MFGEIGLMLVSQQEAGGERASSRVSSISILEAGLPRRLAEFTVAQSSCPKWSAQCEQLRRLIGTGFVAGFVGATGTGKSQMAVSLCKYVMHLNQQAILAESSQICDAIKDTWGTDQTSRSVFNRYMQPAMLAIDELNGGMKDFEIRMIQQIINRRYGTRQLDTILISNETAEDFCEVVGDRVVSRMNETGGLIDFNWPSMR